MRHDEMCSEFVSQARGEAAVTPQELAEVRDRLDEAAPFESQKDRDIAALLDHIRNLELALQAAGVMNRVNW